jgi:hypothetical protein
MSSSAELLRKAAEALEAGEDPFNDNFLSRNEVTFDQCMSLGQQLAIGARIVAEGIEHPRSPEGHVMVLAMAKQL